MLYSRLSGLLFAVAVATSPLTKTQICEGFLPPNNYKIPVHVNQQGGLTKTDFDQVLDVVQKYYEPFIAAKGASFVINRNWEDGTVNASADQYGKTWEINMYGGLARHPVMNKDGFTLVACHEVGHHLGGAPRFDGEWASVEGEADYYATLHCMHALWTDDDNAAFVAAGQYNSDLGAKCNSQFNTVAERNLCIRAGMAGFVGAKLFQALRQEKSEPSFLNPDPSQVSQTDGDHPGTQCRMDTYYAGAKCTADRAAEPDAADYTIASCSVAKGTPEGSRPRCWFAP